MADSQDFALFTVGATTTWGYDAAASNPRRSMPARDLRAEDAILDPFARDQVVSNSRDANRNWTVAAWMIRKHLDFVSDFRFHPKTNDEGFDRDLRAFVDNWSKKDNFTTSKRYSLRRWMRIAEACRTMDGDGVVEKVRGGLVNYIRGDRIRNAPPGQAARDWKHGVRANAFGELVAYCVQKRGFDGRYKFDKLLPAKNAVHHAYLTDADQIRGVSPVTTALNMLRDCYESVDFAMARMKIETLFGVYIKQQPDISGNPFQGNQQFVPVEVTDEDTDETLAAKREAQREAEDVSGLVDLGRGPWSTELRPGEDIGTVQSNNPSANQQMFMEACIQIALKALDIPYSFWREDFTNFVGSRGALQLYRRSASHKQADNQELLDELTRWRLSLAILDGDIRPPRGTTVDDIKFTWHPRGIPWWDRAKEVQGDLQAIGACLDNPESVCLERGEEDVFYNIRKRAEVERYAEQHGVVLNFTPMPQQIEVVTNDG